MTALNMTETAAAVGLRYDHFRKIWREMTRNQGFPQPFAGYRWESEDVEAWKHARSAPPPPREPRQRRRNSAQLSARDQAIAEARRRREAQG